MPQIFTVGEAFHVSTHRGRKGRPATLGFVRCLVQSIAKYPKHCYGFEDHGSRFHAALNAAIAASRLAAFRIDEAKAVSAPSSIAV